MELYDRDGNDSTGGEKGKALSSAISQLEKKYGKGAVMSSRSPQPLRCNAQGELLSTSTPNTLST